jgi:thioredoxin reductase (NADPH)
MAEPGLPVILAVDDTPSELDALRRQLEARYAGRFEIQSVGSTAEARRALHVLKLYDRRLALLIADCDLGEQSGMDLLERACDLFPWVRRVLMAAFDEKKNVVQAARRLSLDHYLLKPWHDPDDDLYPVLDDLLGDWQTVAPPGAEEDISAVRIVGFRFSAASHRVKGFLSRNLIPYRWIEADQSEARGMLEAADLDGRRTPVVFFPDGSHLVQPEIEALAQRVGLQQQAEKPFYDLVVVGGGPAGLSAAVYGASEGLRTLLVEAEAPGGQAGTSSRIENYLGFPSGLSGAELTRRAVVQAQRFGVEILTPQEVTGLRRVGGYRLVQLADGSEVPCYAVLVATGVSYRRLDAPGADALTGAGVYYGAVITEALACQDGDVFVLGGGNSAGQAAMYLARFARSVTILTIGESLGETMSQYLIDQVEESPNIHVRPCCTVSAVSGGDNLETVTVRNVTDETEETLPATALFIYIGAQPRTGWLGDQAARDPQGYLLTGTDIKDAGQDRLYRPLRRDPYFLETSLPGVFAAGDTRFGSVKRIASSVGEGAMAVTLIHQYLAVL